MKRFLLFLFSFLFIGGSTLGVVAYFGAPYFSAEEVSSPRAGSSDLWTDGHYASAFDNEDEAGIDGSTEEKAYEIRTAEQLARLAYLVNSSLSTTYRSKYYKQTANIDLAEYQWSPIGNYSNSNHYFSGHYDGGGYDISNLNIDSSANYVGLFGYIYGTSTSIKNVTIKSGTISTTKQYAGAVVGAIDGDSTLKVINCVNYANVSATSSYVGGIVGGISAVAFTSENPTIANCANYGEITGGQYAGGIIGLYDCHPTSDPTSLSTTLSSAYSNNEDYEVGITYCKNYGEVSGSSYVGGVCGELRTNNQSFVAVAFSYCNNVANITGTNYVGGLIGYSQDINNDIIECYNTGEISKTSTSSSSYAGGLIGKFDSGATATFYRCFNTGTVDGNGMVGGGTQDPSGLSFYDCYSRGDCDVGFASPNSLNCYNCYTVANASNSFFSHSFSYSLYNCFHNSSSGHFGIDAEGGSGQLYMFDDEEVSAQWGVDGEIPTYSCTEEDTKNLTWYQTSSNWNLTIGEPWNFDSVWTFVPGLNDGFPVLQYAVEELKADGKIVSELYNEAEGKMDEANVSDLFGYLLGEENVDVTSAETLAKLTNLANGKMSSADMREKNDNTDISVRFGGLDWWATYLSTDTDGNVILTLWLDESQQDTWADRPVDEGELYGFINGSLYSDWSADWAFSSTAVSYPPNMYGTSYIRAVTLNNGGQYATSYSALSSAYAQNSNSVFARFTMEEVDNSLTQYITTPSQMSWQLNQSAYSEFGSSFTSYNFPNDSINTPSSGSYYSDDDYHGITNYAQWQNDYLWLPSITETGSSSTYDGKWETSTKQRQNYSSSTSNNGDVGSNNVESAGVSNNSWLRSGYDVVRYSAYELSSSGDGTGTYHPVSYSRAVRPALHLNLSKVIVDVIGVQKIVLNNQGGEGASGMYISGEGFFADEALKEPITKVKVPTKAGYVFEGYYTSADGGVQMIEADGTILGSALDYQNITTLFAVWSEGNLAKYDSVGGYWYVENGKMPQTRVTDEATIEALNTSTLSGDIYEFAGMRFGSVKLSGSENEYFKFDDKWYKVEPIRWRLVYSSAQTSGYGTTEATMAILAEIVYVDAYSDAKLMGGAGYSAESVAPFMTNHINEDKFVTETRTVDLFSETAGSATTTVSGNVFVASKEEINLFKTTANGTGETVNVGFSDLVSDYLASLGKGEYYFTRSLGNQLNNFLCLSPVGASTQIKAQQAYGIMFSTKVKGYGCQ